MNTTKTDHTILIFEDDFDLVTQWKVELMTYGYDVHHASHVDEAMRLCEQTQFDLIICDIFIDDPNGNPCEYGGVSLVLNLRSSLLTGSLVWGRTVPVIVVSGSSTAKMNQGQFYTKQLEAKTTLVKPFRPSTLREYVDEILNKKPISKVES